MSHSITEEGKGSHMSYLSLNPCDDDGRAIQVDDADVPSAAAIIGTLNEYIY